MTRSRHDNAALFIFTDNNRFAESVLQFAVNQHAAGFQIVFDDRFGVEPPISRFGLIKQPDVVGCLCQLGRRDFNFGIRPDNPGQNNNNRRRHNCNGNNNFLIQLDRTTVSIKTLFQKKQIIFYFFHCLIPFRW